jgi:hypothetical protein
MVTRSVSEGPWSQPLPEIRPSLTRYEVAHFSREAATAHSRGRQPTEQDENKHVSREAATAHSRGRQPTEQDENKHVSREAAAAEMIAVAASRLEFLCTFFCGLTPAAMCGRRFATQNSATLKLTRRFSVNSVIQQAVGFWIQWHT